MALRYYHYDHFSLYGVKVLLPGTRRSGWAQTDDGRKSRSPVKNMDWASAVSASLWDKTNNLNTPHDYTPPHVYKVLPPLIYNSIAFSYGLKVLLDTRLHWRPKCLL